jgi:hypothetical protein
VVAAATAPIAVQGFGVLGHRVAERVADARLCAEAAAVVARLGGSESLVGLGAWADRVRYVPQWEHTAPWHYLNVADERTVAAAVEASADHVVWAIEHFSAALADADLPPARRSEALRFLVHFVVDVHQPLHVGRADDRGGNDVELRVDGRPTNLHRLWDTGILVRSQRTEARLDMALAALAASPAAKRWTSSTAIDWAEESRALRELVYAFERPPAEGYLTEALAVLEQRLAQAGLRLADRLNSMFCTAASP